MQKIVVAITGASGSIYAKVLLDKLMQLKDQWSALGVVMTENAKLNWEVEMQEDTYRAYPFPFYTQTDFNAPFASGSGQYQTMVIVPCSMGTLGRIATGMSNDLITRAADVVLKERRRLICVVRETPYNLVHIRNMETVTLAGATVLPPVPAFYHKPETIEDLLRHTAGKILDQFGIPHQAFKRWG